MSKPQQLPIPQHTEGVEKNIETSVKAKSVTAAKKLFLIATNRLLNVNRWKDICKGMSATFQLTDAIGIHVAREPKAGDHFKIDLPGPGSSAGDGYDWVKVEEVKMNHDENNDEEYLLMRVRPTDNPLSGNDDVAHFLSDKATSNFVVIRQKNVVTAAVYGRNEVPNTAGEKVVDKLRNVLVGTGAVAGISNIQWQRLVNAVLKKNNTLKTSIPAWFVAAALTAAASTMFIMFRQRGFKFS